ncbi:MAG: signal peptide peptidase SppA [Myxococcales bacterium]|nr:signal peptide peptidase SppA [Myxococcales bacterium]
MRLTILCSIAVAWPAAAQFAPAAEAPAESFALQDDGTSLAGNPAGFGFVDGLEADFLHDGYFDKNDHVSANALYFAGGGGPLALAGGFDWQYGPYATVRRTSLGAALRFGPLSVGAVHRGFNSSQVAETWDYGVLARPFRFLSLGGAVLYANRPNLPRLWRFAAAVRPLGEKLDLAADFRWRECTAAIGTGDCGTGHGDYIFTGGAPLAHGVRLLGQVTLPAAGGTPSWLVGLQLDLPHLGVAYAPRFNKDLGTEEMWRVRLSTQRWPSLQLAVKHAALIDLDKALSRPRPGPLALVFGETRRDPLAETLAALHRLAVDPAVAAVVFRTAGFHGGLGKAEELRAAIEELQAKGKKVVFYLESAGDLEYSLAAAADRVYAAPEAVLLVNGFSSTALFAAEGLDKLGVKAEFFRVGAYKNAPDTFTRSSMSGEQREVESSLLDDLYGRYVERTAARRNLEEGKLKAVLDKGILKPGEAVEAGLLDGLIYPDQLEQAVGGLLGGKVSLEKTAIEAPSVREVRWGLARKIAVVRVEGEILRGDVPRDPLGAVRIAASEPITRRIRRAADDPMVAAIVVRIDSPGGDGNASDLIWRELVRARKEKKKPVIASMGDVAASGGYYVAAGADEILAEPSTVTGSIGVFVGHFDGEELFSKLGLNLTTMKRGESADLFSPARDLTDTERKTLQAWVDNFYEQFLARVAEARGMTRDQVDAIARGRVWTGSQALERKLIDRFGGFEDALVEAANRAGLSPDAAVEIDDSEEVDVELSDFAGVRIETLLPTGIAPRALRAVHLLGEPGTLRAVLPYDLEIQ